MTETAMPCSVAMISDDFMPAVTGTGLDVQNISRELSLRGHPVIVITSRHSDQPSEEIWEGVKVYRVFSIPVAGYYQALPSYSLLCKIFLRHKVGIIHCHYLGLMMMRVLRVAREMGVPAIFTAHMTVDVLTQPFFMRPFRPILSRWIARTYEKFSDIICLSRKYALQVERFNISSQVHYISNPIDFDGTEADPVDSSSDVFRVFFAGRLNPEKNIDLLLRAFRLLTDKDANAQLWIAGRGPQEKKLRQLAESLGLRNQVKFLGHVQHNQLPELYTRCDVFVLPSLVETQGLVAMEAMRFRRPVIVTSRMMSAQDLVDEGINGFIVDAHDPRPLAQRLDLLRNDPALRRKLGEAGYVKSANYTVTAVVDATQKVYQSAVIDPRLRSGISEYQSEKRQQCVFCLIGTFDRRAEHIVVSSNARQFKDEYFAIWRCAFCKSIHLLSKFSLEEYYEHSPYKKMIMNPYIRCGFINLHRIMRRQKIRPGARILFCAEYSQMLVDFFKNKGFSNADGIPQIVTTANSASFPEHFYDAIILDVYLERANDPESTFKWLAQRLKPGGILIFNGFNAEGINLSRAKLDVLLQPYRIHIFSITALLNMARANGFKFKRLWKHHFMDTLWPFANLRAMNYVSSFVDGSDESAFEFRPVQMFRKPWLIPWFVVLGLLGGIIPDKSTLMAVFIRDP